MHLETLASLVEYLDGPWDEELFVMVQSDIGLFLFFVSMAVRLDIL